MTWRGIRGPLALVLVIGATFALGRAVRLLEWHDLGAARAEEVAGTADRDAVSERRTGGAEPARGAPGSVPPRVRLVELLSGLDRPLFLTHAGDGSGRLFVVEQGGRVWILRGSQRSVRPYLDARPLLDESSGERGLLGLAFAPDFARSGALYLSHTAPGPANAVTRVQVDPGSDEVSLARSERIFAIDDPAHNHNGGMIAFGPDGFLWIGSGDGGRAGDPWDNARDLGSRLGKLLRIDLLTQP